jgi:endonuclease G, mitochondrial
VGRKSSIGKKEKIAVSAKNWKIIAVLDRQGLGMQGVDANTSEAIAVMMPNDSSVKGSGWKSFRVSVDLVERETGLNFLSNVPSQVQQIIESKVDSQ